MNRRNNTFFGGLISGNWRGGIGTTWEARIKLNRLTGGAWPAWWLSNDFPGREGEVDLMEWYGNGEWPPAETTARADPYGTAFETQPISVPSSGIEDLNDPILKWPFNDPDYNVFPVLNLAVGGSASSDRQRRD